MSDAERTPTPLIDLDFESKWWLMLPREFPTATDANVAEWATRVATESNVQDEWLAPEYRPLLPQVLIEQYEGFDPGHTVVLWYAPLGLPATGYATIDVGIRPEGFDTSAAGVTAGVTSLIVSPPQEVSTVNLGDGVGFTRLFELADQPDAGTVSLAQTSYVFWPGEYLVIVTAKSADPAMMGLMGSELWSIVESIKLHD